jgi:hypothetical protein
LKLQVEHRDSRRHLALAALALALVAASLLAFAGRAGADQIYWVNPNHSVAYSDLSDTAGGFFSESVNAVHGGKGTAIDTINGRIYIAEEATDQIAWFALNGVGAGVVATAPGTVDHPVNVAIDPATQTLFWANDTAPGSIGFASVDGGGGLLVGPTSPGVSVAKPSRIAVDTLHHRVYWWNELSEVFSWASTDGLTRGNLSTPGLAFGGPEGMGGMAIEPYSTPPELYFVDDEAEEIFHTDPVLGGAPELVIGTTSEKNANVPTGLAFDGTNNKFYWANSAINEEPKTAIGTATIFGRPATLPVYPIAPIHAPAFASVLKTPRSTGEPEITVSGDTLSCTLGHWEADHPGASVYAAPTTLTYEWLKGSIAIVGAGGVGGSSLTATESGSYSCAVVAENAAGTAVETSRAKTITFPDKPKTTTTTTTKTSTPKATPAPKTKPTPTPAAVTAKLASTKPVKVKAGATATVSVALANSGGTTSGSTKVCATLAKQAKKGLKTPACVTVKSVAAGKSATAGLKVTTLSAAKGTYKLTVSVTGATKGLMTAKVQVAKAKRR